MYYWGDSSVLAMWRRLLHFKVCECVSVDMYLCYRNAQVIFRSYLLYVIPFINTWIQWWLTKVLYLPIIFSKRCYFFAYPWSYVLQNRLSIIRHFVKVVTKLPQSLHGVVFLNICQKFCQSIFFLPLSNRGTHFRSITFIKEIFCL